MNRKIRRVRPPVPARSASLNQRIKDLRNAEVDKLVGWLLLGAFALAGGCGAGYGLYLIGQLTLSALAGLMGLIASGYPFWRMRNCSRLVDEYDARYRKRYGLLASVLQPTGDKREIPFTNRLQ